MVLQTVAHIRGVWWVFVMSKVTCDCACKEGSVERERRRGSCASFLSLSDVFLFARLHEQQQEQNQHI